MSAFDEEHDLEVWRANYVQRWIARGGKLTLTNQRLVFRPHLFDSMLGAPTLSWRVQDIQHVEVVVPGWRLLPKFLRPDLMRVRVRGQREAVFILEDASRTKQRITTLLT